MMIVLGPDGIRQLTDEEARAEGREPTPIPDPLTGRTGPMQPGDSLREIAEADEVCLRGMMERRERYLSGDPELSPGLEIWSQERIDAEADRIREMRNAAFAARDEAMEAERTKHSRAKAEKAAAFWAPWQERFMSLVASGMTPRKARAEISRLMVAEGHHFATDTIRKRLR